MLWCLKLSGRNPSAQQSPTRTPKSRPKSTRIPDTATSTVTSSSHDFDDDDDHADFSSIFEQKKHELEMMDSQRQQQQPPGVEFAVSLDSQPVRLIELPPELLDEVEQNASTLQLKSLNGNVANNVVLCTSTQTFAVRQNQSSNTLFIAETATGRHVDDGSSTTFLRAMAQPKGMLEISPSKPDAVAYLKGAIRVLQKDQMHPTSGRLLPSSAVPPSAYEDCLRSAPFSRGEFSDAFESLCAFEFEHCLWIPSPELALEAWKAILDGINENSKSAGIEHCTFTLPEIEATLREYNLPGDLYRAVAERNCSFLEQEATIEPEEYVAWTGLTLLDGVGGTEIGLDTFMGKWRDCLPLAAHPRAKLDLLKSKYELSEDGSTISRAGALRKAPAAPIAVPKVHKWHEKLRAARK